MNVGQLLECFEQFSNDHGKDEVVRKNNTNRPDLHAMLLLDELVPSGRKMVSSAEHDQVWLDVRLADLASVITPEQVQELVRCGVFIDRETRSLSMFV
jgi:hypothetical protein